MKFKYTWNIVRRMIAMVLVLGMVPGMAACGAGNNQKQMVEQQDFLLNTVCNLKLQEWEGTYEEGEALAVQAFDLARELENKMSRTVAGSDIDRINQAAGQPVEITDSRVVDVLDKSISYGELSGGKFDITVGKLVGMWNFSSGEAVVPEEEKIRQEVLHVGYENLIIEAGESLLETPGEEHWYVTLDDPQAHLDLGAIAKGYIVDQVSGFLAENGVTRGIVDFGGNISCIGAKADGSPWLIGIKRPVSATGTEVGENQLVGVVQVEPNCSAVTSGTYERKFEQDGVLYHHILDPETGYPCDTDVSGVTIIGSNPTDCDALSTICLLLGKDKGMALIESLGDAEAVFITNDGEIHCSSGVKFEAVQ